MPDTIVMDLHRTGKRSQWEALPAAKRNRWQRVARVTRGVVTPGNAISLAGAVLVAWGLFFVYRGALGAGLLVLSIGRLADIADGAVASRTKTKSPVGEAVDATIDKLSMLAAIIVLVLAGVVPLPVAAVFALLNFTNVLLGVAARLRKLTMHPSYMGKYSSAFQWTAFLAFVAAGLADNRYFVWLPRAAEFTAWTLAMLALLTGLLAIRGYAAPIIKTRRSV